MGRQFYALTQRYILMKIPRKSGTVGQAMFRYFATS
jgi:hypothetical protein